MKDQKLSKLFLSPKEYFHDVVGEAVKKSRVKASDFAQAYIVDLLEQFLKADKLFSRDESSGQSNQDTLAEMFLKATNDEKGIRIDLLKKLGDTSLYISGFFGDSLNRKIVDLDYYAEMGGTAYGSLASAVPDTSFQELYSEISNKFLDFVEVLNFVSQRSQIQNNENLLRVCERYIKTGSHLAKEHLLEKGIILSDLPKKKVIQ